MASSRELLCSGGFKGRGGGGGGTALYWPQICFQIVAFSRNAFSSSCAFAIKYDGADTFSIPHPFFKIYGYATVSVWFFTFKTSACRIFVALELCRHINTALWDCLLFLQTFMLPELSYNTVAPLLFATAWLFFRNVNVNVNLYSGLSQSACNIFIFSCQKQQHSMNSDEWVSRV